MSKTWKIIIGVVIAVFVIGLVGAGGFIVGRGSILPALGQRPRPMAQLQDRPANPNGENLPDQGSNNPLPPRPRDPNFKPNQDRFFGRGFEAERSRPTGMVFAPFLLLGALMKGLLWLAVLAFLVSGTIFFYRRWQPAPVAAPAYVPVSPPAAPPAAESSTQETTSDHDPAI